MTKRPRCAYSKKPFKTPKRGRPPHYCCTSHRQMAWQRRREHRLKNLPSLMLGKDIDDIRTKAGIERAVVDVLRRFGMLPPPPSKPRRLRIVKSNEAKR